MFGIMSLEFNFTHWFHRLQFGTEKRISVYRTLDTLLRNKIGIDAALNRIYEVFSKNGRKPNDPIARIIAEVKRAYSNGSPLSKALTPWIPYEEMILIRAGEATSTVSKQLVQCINIIKSKGRFTKAIVKCFLYPVFLLMMIGYLMYIVSYQVIPPMTKITDPTTWGASGRLLYAVSSYTVSYGLLTAIVIVLFALLCVFSLPHSFGELRVKLDRIPPWNIYRIIHGSSFLVNLAVLLSAGITLKNSLSLIKDGSSPWLSARINAIIYSTSNGKSLGEALDISGYEFPDRDIIPLIKALSDTGRIDEILTDFSSEWIDRSVEKIDAIANMIFTLGLFLVGALMMLVMTGSNSILSSTQNMYG